MKLHWLSGDVNFKKYGGRWISKKLNNGEFDYWLVIELNNLVEQTGTTHANFKYMTMTGAVAPMQITNKKLLNDLIRSHGSFSMPIEGLVDETFSYGAYAHLTELYGNNATNLLKETRKQLDIIELLFGFYMDKQQNGLGATGWDLIKGEVIPNVQKSQS